LVAEDEMDELVALSSISGKATMNMAEDISYLEQRLLELGKFNEGIFHPEALRPVHICDAFNAALEKTEFENRDKLVLFQMFGEEVVAPLKDIYKVLNQLLIDQGILPKIKFTSKSTSPRSAGGGSGELHSEPAGEEAEFVEQPYQQGTGYSGGGSSGMASARSGDSTGGHHAPSGQQAGMASVGHAPAGQQGGGAYPASHVQQVIQDFVGGNPSQPDGDGQASTGGAGGGSYYTKQEVVGALSNLQSQIQVQPGDKLEFNAAAIKRAVLSTIGEQQGGVVSKAVHQVSEKTIDFIKLIFDAIIEDRSITDAIKTLILSLQIPVIKAAMLDADFFVDDQHPARQLLDKLAEAGVGVSDHNDEVYIAVSAIVDKLLREYEEDIAVFDQALEDLVALVEEIYRKAQEREQQSYEEVQQAHARNIVLQEIRKITLGKILPKTIHTLVLKVWPSMMFNYFLNHGKANDEWVDMLMVLSRIIDSVQLKNSMSELEEMGFSFEDLLTVIEQKLQSHYKKKEIIQVVLDDLKTAYEHVAKQREEIEANKSEDVEMVSQLVEQSKEKTAEPGDDIAAEAMAEEAEEESQEQIAQRKLEKLPVDIKPGTWCIVYNGEGKPVRRLKLAIILVQDATLVFVDHMGTVVIEKDAEQFADELEQNLSGVIMQHSVFDHALNSALGSISTATKH
ncbi:MAG: DUF1631 domain-containing protein, partial [Gammaproteobacteria bacterium]|nr:DUF1631 domain-containing protein [Gammaproteobacteria bacterium]